MRRLLATSGAVLGALTGGGARGDGIQLHVGGEFNAAYMAVFDDDGEGEPGNEHNTDGLFQDAEIHFTGSTVLDNGLEVGARIELAGEDDDDSQIDEAWIYFSGGFGEVRMGSLDEALALMCVFPPGGTENFSAFSPNQWGANTLTSNSVCSGVDDEGDAQKLLYLSPIFGGFQLGLSYTPSGDKKSHADGVGPHLGMPTNEEDASRHNVSVYGTYSYETEDWSLQVGAGGSWEGNVEKARRSSSTMTTICSSRRWRTATSSRIVGCWGSARPTRWSRGPSASVIRSCKPTSRSMAHRMKTSPSSAPR
jgi:predicted porin